MGLNDVEVSLLKVMRLVLQVESGTQRSLLPVSKSSRIFWLFEPISTIIHTPVKRMNELHERDVG